eukprot:1459282-Rhodomonas_salina.2
MCTARGDAMHLISARASPQARSRAALSCKQYYSDWYCNSEEEGPVRARGPPGSTPRNQMQIAAAALPFVLAR